MDTQALISRTTGESTVVTSFKGLDKNFRCRGFQYAIGGTYEHNDFIHLCSSGFHACEHPLDVWGYYDPASRFAIVEQSGQFERRSATWADSKICSTKITIKTELSLGEFIDEAVEWALRNANTDAKTDGELVGTASAGSAQFARPHQGGWDIVLASGGRAAASKDYATVAVRGNHANLAASGSGARLAASGHFVNLAASGPFAKVGMSGSYGRAASSGGHVQLAGCGFSPRLASSGDATHLTALGERAWLAASGDSAHLVARGEDARLAASGPHARLAASGKGAVIVGCGEGSVAKGEVGTWIALAEYEYGGRCTGFAIGCIGQDGLEPDVYYYACGGRLIEAIWVGTEG